MIKAKHSKLSQFIFDLYIFPKLKKDFHSINIIGDIPEINPEYPLIVAPNHSSWWDGFFLYLLNDKLWNRKFHIMILEESLKKLNFFTKIGGFSINQNSPKSIYESLKYTSELMKEDQNSLFVIFPQGILLPGFIPSYTFGKGIDKIIEYYDNKVNLLLLSINLFFLNEEKAEVFLKFSDNYVLDRNNNLSIKDLEEKLLQLRKEVETSILNSNKGRVILSGKKSISDTSQNLFGLKKQ